MKLSEACSALLAAVHDTEIAVNFDKDEIEIYWFGVAKITCNAPTAAKVIPMLVTLEMLGMEDC